MPVLTLTQLLARGDAVAVEQGRLKLTPASGRPVPAEWLSTNSRALIAQAASITGTTALQYIGYSVGNYGPTRAGGITLQFCCLVTGEERFVIFNAHTKRARTSKSGKAGDPLPKGQFRVGKRSGFYRFWESTNLAYQRLANIHQRMGNLRGLIYTADISDKGRIASATLRPLEFSSLAINSQTSRNQFAINSQTAFANKEPPQSQQWHDLHEIPTTGTPNYGNKVIREHGYTGKHSSPSIPPPEQSTDEWLADYGD